MRRRAAVLPGILVTALAAPAASAPAQEPPKGQFPAGWMVRADRPDQAVSGIVFVDMAPGWHITTGPAAILFHPDSTARGEYRIESEIFLFDPGGSNAAFGLLFGARDAGGAGQAYSSFLIRPSGEFLVERRSGEATSTVIDWRPHPAILRYADRGEGATAKNVLAAEFGRETVRFLVNGREVASLPRAGLDPEGVVGLRVHGALNLHVTTLAIERR